MKSMFLVVGVPERLFGGAEGIMKRYDRACDPCDLLV